MLTKTLFAVLLTSLLVTGTTLAANADSADVADCGTLSQKVRICHDDKQITIGQHDQSTSGGTKGVPVGTQDGTDSTPVDPRTLLPGELAKPLDTVIGTCSPLLRFPVCTEPAAEGTPATTGTTVTINDVARFLPARGAVHAEPNGWAVVGVPANFWVDVGTVTVDGTLLSKDAKVRFTPTSYVWDYGDGTTRTSSTPGASWSSLGAKSLTETATSHDFADRATRSVSVRILYSAEYSVAGAAWTAVAGSVAANSPEVPVLVVREATHLTPTT